jgi:hypothetical protein
MFLFIHLKCWPHYDFVIWSATSWKWLEIKLTELGMLTHPSYKICCVLDKSSMFRIVSEVNNEDNEGSKSRKVDPTQVKHSVKPLEILWNKFPDSWNPRSQTCLLLFLFLKNRSRNFLEPTFFFFQFEFDFSEPLDLSFMVFFYIFHI